jgi:putative ABC transport system permease protein
MLFAEQSHAWRALLRTPGFTLTALLTLAAGIGLATTAAGVANAYLLTALPYPAAERLTSIRYGTPQGEYPGGLDALDWRAIDDLVENRVSWDLDMFFLLGGEHAESAPGAWVSPGFAEAFGIRPALGRGFDAEAFAPGGANLALISHRLWRSHFGADPAIVGRSFDAYVSDRPDEAESFTIVGVLPESFWHVNPYTEVLAPLRAPSHPYMARLRPGATRAALAARIESLVRAGATRVPPGWSATVVAAHEAHVGTLRPVLRAATLAAVLVLLVACANVAGLMLLRASRRQREIALRIALGAGRAAVARLLLAEAAILGGSAVILGLLAARGALHALAPALQQQLGRPAPGGLAAFGVDGPGLAFAFAAGVAAVFLSTLVPLAAALGPRLQPALQGAGRGLTDAPGGRRFRAGLIVFEIAASLALVAVSGVMLRSTLGLLRSDLGIATDGVLTASLTLRQSRYPDAEARASVLDRITAALGAAPGVRAVGLTTTWPLQEPQRSALEPDAGGRGAVPVSVHAVTEGYFDAVGLGLADGRGFGRPDALGAPPVAVLGETLARRLWPDGPALGRRITLRPPRDGGEAVTRVVIGVAKDVRQSPADAELVDVYVPLRQAPARSAFVLVRSAGAPAAALPALRAALREVDPELGADRARPLQQILDEATARPRVLTSLLLGFALVAGALSLVGIHGLIAYAVGQREREIAVRLALGAPPARVVRLFVGQAARLLVGGLAAGLAAALVAGRLVESQLVGVSARDPLTLAAAAAAFGGSGLLAAWWPARRAAAVDPCSALRSE